MEPISRIDYAKGKLYFRGHDAAELALKISYEDATYLLLHGHLPNDEQSRAFFQRLMKLRRMLEQELPFIIGEINSNKLKSPRRFIDGIDRTDMMGLLTWANLLDAVSEKYHLDEVQAVLAFVAMCPAVLAAGWRHLIGKPIVPPSPTLNHSHNFMWMMNEKELSKQDQKDIDTCFILHMDDPDNPSLTALRKSIESGNSLSESLVYALEQHIDPLHHGAGEAVMKAMIELGSSKYVETYLTNALDKRARIYGLGHRLYQTIDPRAVVLRDILKRRTENEPSSALYYKIEETAKIGAELIYQRKNRRVYPNVDLYNAAVYYSFGIPYYLNTELFAVSRAAGWAAHIAEWLEWV